MRQNIFDFIIVGSGIAGLHAALRASKKGSVVIITKKRLTDANTTYAQGGIAAVISKTDNIEKHVKDTLIAGAYHNDPKAVQSIIAKGPKAIRELLKLGVPFSKNTQGSLALGREGGHGENRIIHSGDFTGKVIEETLIARVKENPRITVFENTFAKDLLVKNKTCYGIEIMREDKKKPAFSSEDKAKTAMTSSRTTHTEFIFGQKIIVATGGLGQIYLRTTNPAVATGDGIAMAFRAGCRLKDLEFIQFHPTAFRDMRSEANALSDDQKDRSYFLLSEALRGEGAVLQNSRGKRFMPKYDPRKELAPRDIVSRAIFQEEKKGPVFLELKIPSAKHRFPQIYGHLKKHGFDLTKEAIPITPAAHFSCGGIVTDLKGRTNIKHLFAFGEVAWTGLHGANRLASNSLLEGLVMSEEIIKTTLKNSISWKKMAKKIFKEKNKLWSVPSFADGKNSTKENFSSPESQHEVRKLRGQDKQNPLEKIRQQVKKIMWKSVGIVRRQESLQKAIKELQTLEQKTLRTLKKSGDLTSIHDQETLNMVQTGLLITRAALKRKKSLGGHWLVG